MTIGTIILIQLYLIWTGLMIFKYKSLKPLNIYDKSLDGMGAILKLYLWIAYILATFRFIYVIVIITIETDWWNYKLF